MKLTEQEQAMLEGKHGGILQKAMELLVGVGECYDAEQMVPITSVLLASSEPVSVGRAEVKYIKDIAEAGGKFVVPVITDVTCLDMWAWREMGFSEEIYQEQKALSEAIAKMGGFLCNTCTPYHIGHVPRMREHIAWSESSAVIYANAVLGARTNLEVGFTNLAAGLTGKIPNYGYHLDKNRYGTINFIVNAPLKGELDYSTLGYYTGKIAQDGVPIFIGIPESVTLDELVSLSAALATAGSIAHMHVVGVTPEAPTAEAASGFKKISPSDTYVIGEREIRETEESLSSAAPEEVDLAIFGCPHLSIEQVKRFAEILAGRKLKSGVDMWLLMSHVVKQYAEDMGYTRIIESTGAKLVNCCPAVMPADFSQKQGYRVIATDSAKLVYYISPTQNVTCYYGDLNKFVDVVTTKG